MKIELSPHEYRHLLDILHIADLIISGHRKEEDKRTERHRALIQRLYSLLSREGLERLISYNPAVNKFVPSRDFEQNTLAHVLIDEFGDHFFWDDLIARLTVRDAAQIAGGIDHLNAMSDSERQNVEGPIRQRYVEEFAANGVTNLTVIERFSMEEGTPVQTSD